VTRERIPLPSGAALSGRRSNRGHMFVDSPGKPPKLRFQPGSFVRYKGQLCEVIYAYRLQENPHEWRYSLEERTELSSRPKDAIGQLAVALGCGATTPRVAYHVFRDYMQASQYFADIPMNGNRSDVSNKSLLQFGEVISSGEVITP